MAVALREVHVYKPVPNRPGSFVLSKVNPYIRLGCENEILFIQGGKVHSLEGAPIPHDKLPAWFSTELAKVSKTALAEVGWKG